MPTTTHTQRLKHQGRMLDEIMRWKREELPKRQQQVPIATLRAFAATAPQTLDFAAALHRPGVSLIAEIKRASPSRGLLCRDFDPVRLAQTYARGGASAISVLTDSRYFQGQLEYLTAVKEVMVYGGKGARSPQGREGRSGGVQDRRGARSSKGPEGRGGDSPAVPLPVLRKDFIFDPYQVVEARVAGADALLLIVAALSDAELRLLLERTRHYDMAALVEVHDEVDVERALDAGAQIIGINNRDLRTFQVSLDTTARLRSLIPADRIVVSESGIHSGDDVRRLADLGIDAMLVGESLVTAEPQERLGRVRDLVRAGMS